MSLRDNIWFAYDGECPLCQMGASFYRIKKSVGELHLVDARQEVRHPIMAEIRKARLDLDEGMIIKYRSRLYQGAEALHLMAKLSAGDDLLNRTNRLLFQSKRLADFCYPAMKLGRKIALRIKGIGPIENLDARKR